MDCDWFTASVFYAYFKEIRPFLQLPGYMPEKYVFFYPLPWYLPKSIFLFPLASLFPPKIYSEGFCVIA